MDADVPHHAARFQHNPPQLTCSAANDGRLQSTIQLVSHVEP